MIFVDCNIPMYLVGAPHPRKDAARRVLDRHVARDERLVTDAEVFQEILHRYHAIRRPQAIPAAFDVLQGVVDEVFPIELADVELARSELLARPGLSARDAVHVAVMKHHGVTQVMSFDAGFDAVGGLERLE